mgnify:FL=1
MAVSTEQIAAVVMECVNERRYGKAELLDEAKRRTAFNFPQKIQVVINTLLGVGAITRGDNDVMIPGDGKFAQSYEGRTSETTTVKELREQIQDLQKDKDKLIEKVKQAVDAAQEGIKKAEERVKAAEEEAKKAGGRIIQVQLKDGNKKIRDVKGVFHPKFERILQLAKRRKNIFLYGPTGCGKTHVCQQLAEALNLPFYFVSCTTGMSEGQLAGRLLPVGKQGTFEYIIGEFVKAYETGGVFLLDEIDAADPNVLLIINSALANNKLAIPNRPKKPYADKHKDFICIAAANTVGTGANRLYSGRNKLDAATLDRFQIGKVYMDYDSNVESQLCPNTELRTQLLSFREKVRSHRMERAVSTRFMIDAYEMMESGWTLQDVEDALFEGWGEDERNKVKGTYTAQPRRR